MRGLCLCSGWSAQKYIHASPCPTVHGAQSDSYAYLFDNAVQQDKILELWQLKKLQQLC